MCALRSQSVVRHIDTKPCLSSRSSSRLTAIAKVANHSSVRAGGQKQRESALRTRSIVVRAQSSSSLASEQKMYKLGGTSEEDEVQIQGTVVLQRANTVDFNNPIAEIRDAIGELIGQNVKMALVSTHNDEGSQEGRRSETTHLADWLQKGPGLLVSDAGSSYPVVFSVDRNFGTPGALLVESHHPDEFLLKSVTLRMPDSTSIHFVCNSWINNASKYTGPRIFFPNKVYLPSQTPPGIQSLRLEELKNLQGQSVPRGERQTEDRIYDYDVYNDLGNPDESEDLARPVLGGSKEYPYPRRCRTERQHTKTDPASESPASGTDDVYVPRDELFAHIKESDFLGSAIKSFAHYIVPAIEDLFANETSFDSIRDTTDLYTQGVKLSIRTNRTQEGKPRQLRDPLELVRELTDDSTQDTSILKYPLPAIIRGNKPGLVKDDEFARETLAGMNPLVIERLKAFPPVSSLDPNLYGPQTSAITPQHVEGFMEGLSVEQALHKKRLFIVDYHDLYLPYLQRINALQGKGYATRSLFFLTAEGSLKPICIELSLPPPTQASLSVRSVFTPDGSLEWDLAKTHAVINDMGCHELISHWLRTHACVEPFIIALHRNMSALHPLHVLLTPHFRNTMYINGLSRKALINCDSGQLLIGGIIEKSFTPTKYAMAMTSSAYKNWRYDEQGLPADLIKRGMAELDPSAENGLKLLVEDYPYAVDGLQIWSAIQDWVRDYLVHYYKNDAAVRRDTELQSWWTEIREVGHGDKKDGWVSMRTVKELQEVLVTLIWVASAHHAAVNFGQYAYAGFMPNRPSMGRKLIPGKGTPEYEKMKTDPEKFYMEMVSSKLQATIVMTTIELLSTHASDEEYLGQRNTLNWTSDEAILAAFARFGQKLAEIETTIKAKNKNPSLRNRVGAVGVPYTLLFPTSEEGLTGMGIPNSTSI